MSKDVNLYKDIDIDLPVELAGYMQSKRGDQGSLINVLHKVQQAFGYIPEEVIPKVAQEVNVSIAKIYGVITFYHLFTMSKPGKYKIQVCTGTACYLKGAKDLLKGFEALLGIKEGETTDNELFSLETVRCVGCCGLAPVVVVGEDTYGNLKKDQLPEILAKYTKK